MVMLQHKRHSYRCALLLDTDAHLSRNLSQPGQAEWIHSSNFLNRFSVLQVRGRFFGARRIKLAG